MALLLVNSAPRCDRTRTESQEIQGLSLLMVSPRHSCLRSQRTRLEQGEGVGEEIACFVSSENFDSNGAENSR